MESKDNLGAPKDNLGDRMKCDYENRTRHLLPRRTYTLIRIDGKAFHTYTRSCERPYDVDLMADMDATAIALCEQIMGAQFAFVQSDEISILLTDFATPQTEAWFDGNLQKICSVSASIATAHFNKARLMRNVALGMGKTAYFDSRVWTIPQPIEVYNYFLWRQQDASRNSVSMTARAYFSHAQCENKSGSALQEMLFSEKNINWNDLPVGFKRGRVIVKIPERSEVLFVDKRLGGDGREQVTTIKRGVWKSVEPPLFSAVDSGGREWLMERIPQT
jgi:tRNA(His) guanylyltransferase